MIIVSVCLSQDPEQLLTGEGNASGVVDPKLAFWIKNENPE